MGRTKSELDTYIRLNNPDRLNNLGKKIYFVHSMCDYGTEYEKACLVRLLEDFPGAKIINPASIKAPKIDENKGFEEAVRDNLVKYYFPYIEDSDLIVAAPAWNHSRLRGQYTLGAKMEIEYAKSIGKRVIEFSE